MQIEPFLVDVPDAVLDDLRDRLRRTRFPNEVAGAGWEQGTELAYLRELVTYWADTFDWRAQERRLNAIPQFVTNVDGQRIHFLHARSDNPDALPLLLVHGWPGSVVEFLDVIGPLTDDFHVVAPSLPGYTFSGPTSEPGWHPRRMASAFAELMAALGYDRYGAQGGDWGSIVCANVADLDAVHVAGLHLNFVVAPRPAGEDPVTLTDAERDALDALRAWRRTGAGYQEIQGTRPQSLGYGLEDSPAGLAAWLVEKFRDWSDCGGDVERSFTKDQLLTNITAYWVTGTATSSCRLYYEMRRSAGAGIPAAFVGVPTGVANFPGEITKPPRRWVEARYNVVHWSTPARGGHFAAMEVPEVWLDDVRTFFGAVS